MKPEITEAARAIHKHLEEIEHNLYMPIKYMRPDAAEKRLDKALDACSQAKIICARLVGEDWHMTKETE